MALGVEIEQSLAAKFSALLPHLDERTQRLYLGSEARSLGHGGIATVARASGVSRATVAAGVDEVESGAPPAQRMRRPGGGRKRATDIDPGLRPALLALVEPEQRGDPMSPLRWTTKSTRTLATELTRQGHRVSADTVADILRAEGFSLQANAKTIEGAQHPDRDAQFRYINEQVTTHQAAGDPVVSVDTKKKELVGQYKNTGQQWRPAGQPTTVQTHDFPDKELGKAIPYGIYDLAANTGWVGVGIDHDTAAFAVACLRRWWQAVGRAAYPRSRRLLLTADAGGSNGYRTRAWKTELAVLAAETGLDITVCHFPPGTSKWNTIEHRLFSHITMSWRGRPLSSHEVIVNSIAATTTRTGLTVHAELDTGTYQTGIRVSDEQIAELPINRHDWHGEWNYTLLPYQPDAVTTASAVTTATADHDDRAWLTHPALTGLPAHDWNHLLARLATFRHQQRETELFRLRGGPRHSVEGAGRKPALALADRVAATLLHYRFGLPQTVIAELFGVTLMTANRAIRQINPLLDQAGHVITPTATCLRSVAELTEFAARSGAPIPNTK